MYRRAYNPSERVRDLLNWVLARVKKAPYNVTTRWAFYRCVQEFGLRKEDYGKFLRATSVARKRFWNGWAPWTLVDDTRSIYRYGDGSKDYRSWLEEQANLEPRYEVYPRQEKIVQIWFEAQAMFSQFYHYAAPLRITLVPFRGDPGNYHKWQIVYYLSRLYKEHRKPIAILYFGDYEPFRHRGSRAKGLTIPISALKDIEPWLAAHLLKEHLVKEEEVGSVVGNVLQFERVGLNREHVERWKLPENPDRPGEYQWEALSEEYAEELILGSIRKHWKSDAVRELEDKERRDAGKWRKALENIKR